MRKVLGYRGVICFGLVSSQTGSVGLQFLHHRIGDLAKDNSHHIDRAYFRRFRLRR